MKIWFSLRSGLLRLLGKSAAPATPLKRAMPYKTQSLEDLWAESENMVGKPAAPAATLERAIPYKTQPDEYLLAESENPVVVHAWEYAAIVFKQTLVREEVDDFYGNPQCAAIGPKEDWVLIGGEHLTLWKNGTVGVLAGANWIHDIRVVDRATADILTDP